MFKSISYHGHNRGSGLYSYYLMDDKFETTCFIPDFTDSGITAVDLQAVAVFLEYKRRSLPVAPNVALLFLWNNYNTTKIITHSKNWIVGHYPEYEKYHACILRQMKQKQFGRGVR